MNVSCPSVHPVAVAPLPAAGGVIVVPKIRMKDVEGMPATLGGVGLRALQFLFAALSLVFLASTLDFPSITAYDYLVFAMSLQSSWSLSMGVVDVYALLVRRSLHNASLIRLFTIGDGITSTLTFTAACASAGITILITNDLDRCAENPCLRLEAATAMALLSWFAESPSFLLNYWSLASR